MHELIKKDISSVSIFYDVTTILENLAKDYIIAILSNQTSLYQKVYENSEVRRYISFELFSHLSGIKKPNFQIYLDLCKNLKTPPSHCVMIGDNELHDYTTPRLLGMQSFHLSRKEASSGSRINSLDELKDWL